MKDFLIVGRGLAASCLMHAFHRNNLTFQVIGDPSLSSCSRVAAGIYNPIVFKRLTKSWMADELIPALQQFYSECETQLGTRFLHAREILRPFTEAHGEELWRKK